MLTKEEILRNLNIERLTPMQEAALEAGSGDKDMILLSPTGSGKTLAYLLPLLGHLREGQDGVQAVVLVPSRELALQIESVFKSMGTPFRVMSCYGGRPAMEEHRAMNGIRPSVIGTFARPQAASAEEGEILIRGTIYGENREPLSGANVTETDGDGRVVSATKTDSNGKFSFKIRSREHDINFQQNGYYKQQQPIGSKSVFHIQMEIDPYVE